MTACLIASWMTMDLRAMYAGLAMPESQVEAMVAMNRRQLPLQIATSIILALAALGYAVYVRRFFKAPSDQAARAAPGAGFGSTPNPEP